AALRSARAGARDRVWSRGRPLGGAPGTRDGGQVIVDIDATLVTAHSDKEGAGATHKKSYGFAPRCAFVDHGEYGTGETLALDLRPGKASPFSPKLPLVAGVWTRRVGVSSCFVRDRGRS